MRTDDRRLAEGAQQRLELALPGGRLQAAAPLDSPGPGEVVRLRPAGGVESPHI